MPENTVKTLVPPVVVLRDAKKAPSRYRNEISKYIIRRHQQMQFLRQVRRNLPQGVHVLKPGYKLFAAPHLNTCIGPSCAKTDHFCIDKCPNKALKMVENPMLKGMVDYRWTPDLILTTWKMAKPARRLPPTTIKTAKPATPAAASTGCALNSRKTSR